MTDREAIEAALRGEREAFGALVARYQRMVEAVAFHATGHRGVIDDVVQDTFVTAWRTLDRLRDPERVRPWLCGIARNIARKARRRARHEVVLHDVGTSRTPFDDASEREREREMTAALAGLPARYREPIVLFYYEQCSVKEVAAALALGEDAVMQRLSRGRRRLGESLATCAEVVLESKVSRGGLVACVLALLPAREAAAAATTTAASAPTSTTATTTMRTWLRSLGAGLVARWRIPAAMFACAAAAILLRAAVVKSDAVAAHNAARRADHKDAPPPPAKPPELPPPEHSDRIYRNISVASTDAAESCARAVRGLVNGTLGKDAYRKVGNELYFEPSPAVQRIAEADAANAAASCGDGRWPELYVVCEGTMFDIMDGNVTCYPYDPFYSS